MEAFVWAGRPRVDRNTLSQSKARGGLGLRSVLEQYRAMTGNLMVWILGSGAHPLRSILQAHIQDLSCRRWGVSDLSDPGLSLKVEARFRWAPHLGRMFAKPGLELSQAIHQEG